MIHNVVDFSGVKVRDVMLPSAKFRRVVGLVRQLEKRWRLSALPALIVCQ